MSSEKTPMNKVRKGERSSAQVRQLKHGGFEKALNWTSD